MMVHHDQGINQRRSYNNCKYQHIQHSTTSIHKANDKALKGKIYNNPIIMVGFNTPPTSEDIIQTENQ